MEKKILNSWTSQTFLADLRLTFWDLKSGSQGRSEDREKFEGYERSIDYTLENYIHLEEGHFVYILVRNTFLTRRPFVFHSG